MRHCFFYSPGAFLMHLHVYLLSCLYFHCCFLALFIITTAVYFLCLHYYLILIFTAEDSDGQAGSDNCFDLNNHKVFIL